MQFFGLFYKRPEQIAEEAARSRGTHHIDKDLLNRAHAAGLESHTLLVLMDRFGSLQAAMVQNYLDEEVP